MLGAVVNTQMTTMRNSAVAVAALANNKGQQQQQQQQQQVVASNLTEIMRKLQVDYGNYKYTVYRCASKFVALQKIFHTGKIPYKLVLAILERHGMPGSGGNCNLNLMVPPFQLTSLLHDIYFACEKLGHFTKTTNYQLETATALLANFFWNIYDPQRRHSISLLEIKVTFLLLCKLYSSEHMIADFYSLLADGRITQCVSRYAFEQLLLTLSKLLSYLGESKAYGAHNLPAMLEQCFARCHHGVAGLDEQQFHSLWTQTQTRFLIYGNLLALIKRIEDTEHLIHSNSCAGCRSEHIIGIRFKCQVCRDLSLCLPCFAAAATHVACGKHEASHRMCEVFVEDHQPHPRRWTHYLSRLCNWFAYHAHKTQRADAEEEERRGFCNAQESTGTGSVNQPSNATELAPIPAETRSIRSNSTLPMKTPLPEKTINHQQQQAQQQPPQQELCSLTGLASNASERMQSIIDRLLLQNTKLETQLQHLATTSSTQISEFLSAHQSFLLHIIEDMRQLSRASSAAPLISSTFLNSSTPQRLPLPVGQAMYDIYAPVGANLTHSINGAELNRSYLEANKSDYSLSDISLWFDQRRSSMQHQQHQQQQQQPQQAGMPLGALLEQSVNLDVRDTEMVNFRLLLHKVKEIVEDSYSDNAELSAATQNLENVLDNIIKGEEQQRRSSCSASASASDRSSQRAMS
ncbi:dystrophin isoform X2 [Drosophila grimshawi]|uniref:GH24488 n=1 Tax=Drosophila grimshawi TaxID=7222 RepID=B4JLN5_DROGR|nr:dystrophin isoform X2 [Drosophila grimshawi]EDV91646.1 GH24488 [Drosophila grimshawi]